jgi:hypothetical protein
MTYKLIEVGRGYGMEIHVEKLKQWEFQINQPHYRLR